MNKRKILSAIYITFGIFLFLSVFSMIVSAVYVVPKMFCYGEDGKVFVYIYNIFSWIIFGMSVLCEGILIYNFFAKKKLNVIELVLFVFTFLALITAIVYCSINRFKSGATDLNSIFVSYITSYYEYLAIIVVLFVSKLLIIIGDKNDKEQI